MSGESPMDKAQAAMRAPLPKRFYERASTDERDGARVVLLDGRPVRTPARRILAVASPPLAEAIAAEWNAQRDHIDPMSMPLTRIVNSALDGVADNAQSVRDDLLRFVAVDLLCYRADGPRELVERQNELWDPVLDWAREARGIDLVRAVGVVHVEQPARSLARTRECLAGIDPVRLAALHVMTTLGGSAVLALAVMEARVDADAAWAAAHVDEDWQASQWGRDAEALRRRNERRREFDAAARVTELMRA